nr:unnamed protein product [Callosobruchus chinensis]
MAVSTEAVEVVAVFPPMELEIQDCSKRLTGMRSAEYRELLFQRWQTRWNSAEKGRWTWRLIKDVEQWANRPWKIFGLVSDDYRKRVWRERGGQNRLATAIGVAPCRGGTQMFWGGIRFNERTQLIHVPGAYYLQNIINAIVQPLRNEIGDQFIFMDDNARPHRTRAVQQALENGNVARLEWPAMSPDMNLIEHVWDYVSRAIFNRNNPPRSTQELIVAATEEWDNIPQEAKIVKECLRRKYLHRLRQIWSSELSVEELRQLDTKTRKRMNMERSLHPKSSVPRIYLPRHLGGRGLLSLERLHNRVVLATACYVTWSTDPLICFVRDHENAH